MYNKIFFTLIVLFLSVGFGNAINENHSAGFYNIQLLDGLFAKLHHLQESKHGKINIVHIGDSHIQADMLTNEIRQDLQQEFGNGGLGFTFPYKLLRTNSNHFVQYTSNQPWQSVWNIKPVTDKAEIGLSGIALYTPSQRFYIELKTDSDHSFNKIKLIYPSAESPFDLSFAKPNLPIIQAQYEGASHKIKSGETLSTIAQQYHVTVKQLTAANHLKNSRISAGKTLIIPEKKIAPVVYPQSTEPILPEEELLKLSCANYMATYTSATPLHAITILPHNGTVRNTYNLSGIVLENNQPGIIYHSIGVNGAKTSDFNKCPLFFDQLDVLHPDLVIISFGTNESFGKLSPEEYLSNINAMVNQIRSKNKDVAIIVTTPSPSFLHKKYPNKLVAAYSDKVIEETQYVVWDLFHKMGGLNVHPSSLDMGKRKIHYTQQGYAEQGRFFVDDFLKAYSEYEKH